LILKLGVQRQIYKRGTLFDPDFYFHSLPLFSDTRVGVLRNILLTCEIWTQKTCLTISLVLNTSKSYPSDRLNEYPLLAKKGM